MLVLGIQQSYSHTHFFFQIFFHYQSVSSVTQSCPTLFDPMDCSTPGFPVHHQLPELAQTHVCRIGDAIQQSYPLSSSSPPASNLFHYRLFMLLILILISLFI